MRDNESDRKVTADPGATPQRSPRKAYRSPRLVEYGSLQAIVMAKGGTRNDGGSNPKTKR